MANSILTRVTVIVASSLIVSGKSLDINVQPQSVNPSDKNVAISCNGAGSNSSKVLLERLLRMRLMKLDDEEALKWTEVAVLGVDESIDLAAEGATAVGRLGDVFDSHLVVTWSVAPNNIYGTYRCDASALTSSGNVVTVESTDLDVKSRSDYLLSPLIERLKKSEQRLLEKVNETMHRTMKSSKINLLSVLDSKFGDMVEYLEDRMAATVNTNSRPEEEVEARQWPEGEFTLLMPSDGCPLHPPSWTKSFTKSKAQPEDIYYPIDVPLHLANPHKKNGFIYRQYCSLGESPERTQPWPAGSYCMYLLFKISCPAGFHRTFAVFKVPHSTANFYTYYRSSQPQSGSNFTADGGFFCCRHDGNASTPIHLPVSDPFYLVRMKGRCQEVKGMDVTQDVFMMQTVDDDDRVYDKWYDDNTDFRPDVSFKPYKEDLCYYSKSRD